MNVIDMVPPVILIPNRAPPEAPLPHRFLATTIGGGRNTRRHVVL
jgi:hypothetical protein